MCCQANSSAISYGQEEVLQIALELSYRQEMPCSRGGGNYQTLINKALREHIESGKKSTLEETLRRVIREELRTSP